MRTRICFKCDLYPSHFPIEEKLEYMKKQALNEKGGPVDYISKIFKQVDEKRIGHDSFEKTFEADFYILTREDAEEILGHLTSVVSQQSTLFQQIKNILDREH